MKTQCLQTNETQHYGKGKCLRSRGWSRERIVLTKSLILHEIEKRCAWGAVAKSSWKCQLILISDGFVQIQSNFNFSNLECQIDCWIWLNLISMIKFDLFKAKFDPKLIFFCLKVTLSARNIPFLIKFGLEFEFRIRLFLSNSELFSFEFVWI